MYSMCYSVLILLATAMAFDKGQIQCSSTPIQCKFKFCRPLGDGSNRVELLDNNFIVLRAPKSAGYPFICRRDFLGSRFVIRILSTGDAIVHRKPGPGSCSTIDKDRTKKLAKKFGVFNIPLGSGLQSVGRSSPDLDTDDLDRAFVTLPVKSYAVSFPLSPIFFKSIVVENTAPNDCIHFGTRSPDIIVDVFFKGNFNISLSVRGPNGKLGLAIAGNNFRSCFPGLRSAVFNEAKPGSYKIDIKTSPPTGHKNSLWSFGQRQVVHTHPCPGGGTPIGVVKNEYRIQANVLGNKILDKRVVGNSAGNVTQLSFNFSVKTA